MSRKPNIVPVPEHVDQYRRLVREAIAAGRQLRKQVNVSTEKEPTETEIDAAEILIVETCNLAGKSPNRYLVMENKQMIAFAKAIKIKRAAMELTLASGKPPADTKPN